MSNRAHELAAHVADACKYVLDLGPLLGNALVAPLLAVGERLASLGFALQPVFEAQNLEHFPALCAGVGFVCVHFFAGVVWIQHLIKVVPIGKRLAIPSGA